ncbi:MAG: PhzF family phenazine biosynthesis protein [Epulopiscium sp.]|nr:PhzF family phenazine biosynthesis protein [Candidatus Epulonipiscium sp.]
MKYYVVDAFTEEVFGGNPAGVCVLTESLSQEKMQKIASENNLSETAFVQQKDGYYDLKWFTPVSEIDLCGHATLATAFVISNFVELDAQRMEFHTLSGKLVVEKKKDLLEMDFPSRMPQKRGELDMMAEILGVMPKEVYLSRDWVVLLESEEEVRGLTPDFTKMRELKEGLGVIVTAKGNTADFVSRCFYPEMGVPEDPVTGSAHSNLIPFWAQKLGKEELLAYQLSARGGVLYCKNCGERVKISGKAVLYMIGEILV